MRDKGIQWLAALVFALTCVEAEADGCRIIRQSSLPITFNGFVPTVPASINGTPVRIGVDTGSSATLLTPETVARLSLPQDSRTSTLSRGTGGAIQTQNVYLESLGFGGASELMKSVAVVAIGGPGKAGVALSPDATMAGLIGTEMLSGYDVEFRFPAHRLNLYRVSNCPKVVPPWKGRFTSIPVSISPTQRFVVPLKLDGHPLTAVFDTGSSGLRISREAALRIGVTGEMLAQDPIQEETAAGNMTYQVPFHRFEQVTIGGETFHGPRIDIIDSPLTESDMLLGEDYMHARRFWLSYATKTLFVQPLRMTPRSK
jgi:predicted aspartyl protease